MDTGAQPTVVKKSFVPQGTPIIYKNWYLQGVRGPKIGILGTADIAFEIGLNIFTQECVIVEDAAIQFPAKADVIIGANMLILHQLDVSPSQWALLHEGNPIQHFEPARVNGKVFSSAEYDYVMNSDAFPGLEPEVGCEDDGNVDSSYAVSVDSPMANTDRKFLENYDENTNAMHSNIKQGKNRYKKTNIYPTESAMRDILPDEQVLTEQVVQPPKQHKRQAFAREPDQPQERQYNIATIANCCVPSQQMGLVDVTIIDGDGAPAPAADIYELDAGIIFPGAILLPGISSNKCKIAIINYNSDSLNLPKGIPFATATKVPEEDLLQVAVEPDKFYLDKPEVYQLMALSAITEEAFVTSEEYSSEPSTLQDAMDYDPAQISTKEIKYDDKRFKKLLTFLNAKDWKLSRDQHRAAEKMLYDKQRAFNLKSEPLPMTHLLTHDIELKDPSKIIFVKPRWTPMHQRPPIEQELKGLLDHDLATTTMSPHSSPVILVRKKKPGQWHLAVDF